MITALELAEDIYNSRIRKFTWVLDELELQTPETSAEIDFLIDNNNLLERINL